MPLHSRPLRHLRGLRLILIVAVVVVTVVGLAIAGAHRTNDTTTPIRTTALPPLLPPTPSPGHKAFFVSISGDDENPGTQAKPWRTIARAMMHKFAAGDQLLFDRGGEYFGTIDQIPTPDESRRWLIGAYGNGPKPIITNAKTLNDSAAWIMVAPNIWRIDLKDATTHGGWMDGATNIGFLRAGSTVHGVKKKSINELRAQWDFYDDSTYLYVLSTANPTSSAPDLRAAPDSVLIRVHSNMEIDGIEMRDCGGHAMRSEVPPVVNVHVLNNYIHDIGGSFLIGYADDQVRYGNAIECLDSCADWLVKGNEVHDVYDTAFTCQGSGGWTNIRVTQNFFHDNSHNLEFWTKKPGPGLNDILIDDNDFEGGGGGWGGAVRPDPENRAQFISFGWDLPAEILLTKNRVRRAYGSYVYFAPEVGYPTGWVFTDNDIQLVSGTPMQYGQPFTVNDAAAWAAENRTESGSTFEVLAAP